jgi:hypothetical protein
MVIIFCAPQLQAFMALSLADSKTLYKKIDGQQL